MRICAVIIAGGRSSRMGREKAFESIRGRTIIGRVMERVRPQVETVILNANGDATRFGELALPVINDLRSEIGTPLAGVHAALNYAQERGYGAVLTVPSDTPFLPAALVRRLRDAAAAAAIAASGGQQHYLTGLWSSGLLGSIERALSEQRTPRLQDWAQMCDAAVVDWPVVPYDPFFNVNTPDELAEAERIAAEFMS